MECPVPILERCGCVMRQSAKPYLLISLHAVFSVITSSSSRALSPANDSADTRVRQSSKQREEELELIEQLRKVRADKASEALVVCRHVKAALVFWTDCAEPVMGRHRPERNGTVQAECFCQMEALEVVVFYCG